MDKYAMKCSERNTNDYNEILMGIRKRPKMYLGKKSLRNLHMFMEGYKVSMYRKPCTFIHDEGFMEFIHEKYNDYVTLHYFQVIERHSNSEEEAFDKYFELLDEFTERKNSDSNFIPTLTKNWQKRLGIGIGYEPWEMTVDELDDIPPLK